MTKNPLLNALGATGYILLIVAIINTLSSMLRDTPDTAFAPVIALSLLTLSAAVMAYIFFYQPLLLVLDGKKKQAVTLFTKTVGIFAVFTTVGLILLIFRII